MTECWRAGRALRPCRGVCRRTEQGLSACTQPEVLTVTKKPDRFTGVTFHDEVRREAADHEVFMGFNGDSDATAFREWWEEEGAVLFAAYLKRSEGVA
jgi:hypothetical protein